MKIYEQGVDIGLFRLFWKVKVMLSTKHLTWMLILNTIATKKNLRSRGILLGNDKCVMCAEGDKIVSLLFFTYMVVTRV